MICFLSPKQIAEGVRDYAEASALILLLQAKIDIWGMTRSQIENKEFSENLVTLARKNKIEAVKLVRAATNWGLLEAKEYVESQLQAAE